MPVESERYVQLVGGLVLPVEAIILALELEARGFTLQPDGEDIIVRPFSQLTPEDCRLLRRWKRHVLAVLSYEPPMVT
jgi:hypothetical protein